MRGPGELETAVMDQPWSTQGLRNVHMVHEDLPARDRA